MKANITKCSATIADAISKYVSGAIKADGGKVRVIDLMQAEGVVPSDLQAPEKGADRTTFESYKAAVVRGFPAAMQKLVQASPAVAKGYSPEQKADRRKWTQRIGADMRDLRVALERRYEADRVANLTEEQREAEAAEAAATASEAAKLLRDATAWINRLEKATASTLPVLDCLSHFKALAAIATATMK